MAVSDLILNIAMFGCFSSAQLRGVVVDYEGGEGAAGRCSGQDTGQDTGKKRAYRLR